MSDPLATTPVPLTAAELLLLRGRLTSGPGTPAVDSALDAKLFDAQRRLELHSDSASIAEAMRKAKENPGHVVGLGE